ncbi:hypothetical protein FC093_07135 [Ilyomonas limi]|uniref:Uncharacterized protein n=1 Tax=Ilyomonas limi TaxID=2575867 RepID=A0A4U3L4H9_9BACT|nr:DUF6526 family protein [Ilyomonas limi]TKK69842.1 hypothetical protein FC093_07135 [Ilyomonas limi]
MKEQNYKNHIRFYPAHHFVFYPIAFVLAIASAICIFKYPFQQLQFAFITAILILIIWLSFMLRQHYALGNQNRIVRLEMRLRYYVLTQKRFEPLEQQLSFDQIAALRFASDEELPDLVGRTINESLSSKDIKKAIRHWTPDHMRL